MKKLFLIGFTLLVCVFDAAAQFGYYKDAILFGQTYAIGTARMQAIGGAQTALGGDINAAHANPAGLGFNRSSMVTFTPSVNFYNSQGDYFGQSTADYKTNLNVANLGVLFNFANSDFEDSKFKGGSFAITMTRENNFNSDVRYEGYNNNAVGSSVIDLYLDQLNFPDPSQPINPVALENTTDFEYYGLYQSYLINPQYEPDVNGNDSLAYYYKFIGDNPRQMETLQTSGNQSQWDFAYGGNYNDVIYFGASLNVNTINYKSESVLTEREFIYDNAPDEAIDYLSTREDIRIKGTGVSGTFGLIVRPVDFFRFGLTAVTPTFYEMRREETVDMKVQYNNFVLSPDIDPLDLFYYEESFVSDYSLRTPFKLTTGLAFFLGKIGFISADIDFLDYSQATLKSRDFNVTADNQAIKDLYKNTVNLRVGSEIRLDVFRIRGGYSYQGDPYVDNAIDQSIQRISGGIGFRNKEFFVDVAAVHSKWNTIRTPYVITDLAYPTAYVENQNLNVSVTVGVNF